MSESVALRQKLVSGTPGVDGVVELEAIPDGDTIRGALAASLIVENAVIVGGAGGIPTTLVLDTLTLLGRMATGAPVAINNSSLLQLLRAVVTSSGAGDGGKPVVLDSTGLLDPSVMPPVSSGGEANDGANLGTGADGGALFAQKNVSSLALEFRRLLDSTPDSLTVTETANRLELRIVMGDGDAASTTKLWSSSKTRTEILTRLADVVGDTTPELGGDLDLGAFRLMSGATEVLRYDSGDLYILDRKAIIANQAGVQDGWGVYYDLGADDWLVGPPPSGGSGPTTASELPFVPVGNVSGTDVQAAIAELDTEKSGVAHTHTAAELTDTDMSGALDGDILTWRLLGVGGADGALPESPIPIVLSPSAFDLGRILFSDASGSLVDVLLDSNLLADWALTALTDLDQSFWDSTANGGSGGFVNRQPLNSENFYVRLGTSFLLSTSWATVPWDEALIHASSTPVFALEGGSGTTDRIAVGCSRAGSYIVEVRFTGRTLDNLTTDSTTGANARSLVYQADDTADINSATWTPVVGSTVYVSTGPVRELDELGGTIPGASLEQTTTYSFPVTLAAGERIRVDLQQQSNGNARIEAAAAATAVSIRGPFAQ